MDRGERRSAVKGRSLKRKLEEDFEDSHKNIDLPLSLHEGENQDLLNQVVTHVGVLNSTFSWAVADRSAAKRATYVLSELAKNEELVNLIVGRGAVPALVRHLQAPPEDGGAKPLEHEVEKESAFTLGLLAAKPEHQQLIVDAGALPHLVDLLKRDNNGCTSRALTGVIRRAADAITNLAHDNSNIKSRVRIDGGIPPLVHLLGSGDAKVQRAAAGTLRTLAFKNDNNKNQIVECNALPTLILMLRSEDSAIHYEAVGVIGNLVHSSPSIKREVLLAGALQPVIRLLSSSCPESQREAALLLGQFAAADSDCKVHVVQRGALPPLIEMLHSVDAQLREMSAFALGRLAQDCHNQAGIAQSGGVMPLLKLLQSKNPSLQHNAAFALYGLADNEDNVADLIRIGGVQRLQEGDFIVQPTKDCVAKTMKRLEEKINGRVLSHLLYPLRFADKVVQRRVALALAHLSSPEHQRRIFIDCNGLELLLELLGSLCAKQQQDASIALYKMAAKATLVSPIDAVPSSPTPQVYLGDQYVNNPTLSDVTFLVEGCDPFLLCNSSLSKSFACSIFIKGMIFRVISREFSDLKGVLTSPYVSRTFASCMLVFFFFVVFYLGPLGHKLLFMRYGCLHLGNPRSHPRQDLHWVVVVGMIFRVSDVISLLVIIGKRFYAHRICLLASSDAFRAMFDGGYRERDAKDVEIPNIRWDVFELMMRFIYTGTLKVALDIAQDLLRAADQYLLDGLKRHCEHAIAQDISADNVTLMYELSEAYNAMSLRQSCILLILEQFDQLHSKPWYTCLIQRIIPEIRTYFQKALTSPD